MAYLGARKRTTRQASSQAVNRRRSEGGPRAWFASIDWNSVRFRTVAVLFFVVWGALWVRAGYVQLWEGPFLAERARRQHMAAETVAMPRGMITDRNGHILARSVECCSVYANPSIITDIEATATTLAGVLGRPVDQIKPLLEKKRSFVWIARRVDDATAEAIRQADLTGVELSREFERIYPYRQVAGQLLGFVGMDGKGLEGIERSFDEQLGGLSVRQAVRRDASGREFYVNSNYEAQPAEDVHLTLDLQVQSIAEEEISKAVTEFGAKWGGVLVVDVAAGDVLAWAQFPFFNPNSYNQYRPSEYRNAIPRSIAKTGCGKAGTSLSGTTAARNRTSRAWRRSSPTRAISAAAKSGWSSARSSTSVTFPGLASANARASSSPRAAASCARRANGARPTLFPLHSDRAFRSRCSRWRRPI